MNIEDTLEKLEKLSSSIEHEVEALRNNYVYENSRSMEEGYIHLPTLENGEKFQHGHSYYYRGDKLVTFIGYVGDSDNIIIKYPDGTIQIGVDASDIMKEKLHTTLDGYIPEPEDRLYTLFGDEVTYLGYNENSTDGTGRCMMKVTVDRIDGVTIETTEEHIIDIDSYALLSYQPISNNEVRRKLLASEIYEESETDILFKESLRVSNVIFNRM